MDSILLKDRETSGLTHSQALLAETEPLVGVSYLKQNIVAPLLNNALLEPYNAVAHSVNAAASVLPEAELLRTGHNEFASSGWFVQAAAGGVGMIVPYTVAGKLAGGTMRQAGALVGAEGFAARTLKNQALASVVGAAAYDGLRVPKEGETRLGNMLGGATAFSVFGAGNHLLAKEMGTGVRIAGRVLVGAAGASSQLAVSRYAATGELPAGEEFLQASVSGAFLNNVMPHAQKFTDQKVWQAERALNRPVWLDQYVDAHIQGPRAAELIASMERNPWAKVKFGEHNDFRSGGRGTILLEPSRSGQEEIARGLNRIEQTRLGSQEANFQKSAQRLAAGDREQALAIFRDARATQETQAHDSGQITANQLTGRTLLKPENLNMEIGAWAGPGKQSLEMRFRQEFNQFADSQGKWRPGQTVEAQKVAPVEVKQPGPGAGEQEMAAYERRRTATDIAHWLQQQGHIAVFAGGAVRDEIVGVKPKDFDVATSASPDAIEALLVSKGFIVNQTGKTFGVIKAKLTPTGDEYDIATLRNDGQYTDGRRPDSVQFVPSLYEDAARRDITFNALFADPISGVRFDFFGGQKDLANKVVRMVGDPHQRFSEDYLRMMRVPRFLAQKFPDFTIEAQTKQALADNAHKLAAVAPERLAAELRMMLKGKDPVAGLDLMMETGQMRQVLPEVADLTSANPKAMQDPIWHPEGDVWTHTRMVLRQLIAQAPPEGHSFETMAGALLHDIGKPATQKIWPTGGISNHEHAEVGAKMAVAVANRLKLSGAETKHIEGVVANHMKMHDLQKMKPARLKQMFDLPFFPSLKHLQHADATGTLMPNNESKSNLDFITTKQKEFAEGATSSKPGAKALVGGDLLIQNYGLKPGKRIGEITKAAYEAQQNGEFTTAEEAVKWLEANIPEAKK